MVNKNSRIVDIGSGTGLVGECLNKHGFDNLDALEPSSGMVEISEKRNVYKKHFVEPINADQKTSLEASQS